MDDALKLANEIYSGAIVAEYDDSRVDVVCRALIAAHERIRELEAKQSWRPIESAPKGGGAEKVTDPNWVDPPLILLAFDDGHVSVARWDWYYAEGGRGYRNGDAWVEPCSGDTLDLHYGFPTHWMPLPEPPK